MPVPCFVKNCGKPEEHFLRVDNIVLGVCDFHLDDANEIMDNCQDETLKIKRDARNKIRHLVVKDSN